MDFRLINLYLVFLLLSMSSAPGHARENDSPPAPGRGSAVSAAAPPTSPAAPHTPVVAAAETVATVEGTDRPFVQACYNLWQTMTRKTQRRAEGWLAAGSRTMADYFPTHTTPRTNLGRTVNYSQEELNAFTAAIDQYFTWNDGGASVADWHAFRDWLKATYGREILPLENLPRWIAEGRTLHSVINDLYPIFVTERLRIGAEGMAAGRLAIKSFTMRKAVTLAGRGAWSMAGWAVSTVFNSWKGISALGVLYAVNEGVFNRLIGRQNLERLETRARRSIQDREAVTARLNRFREIVDNAADDNYGNRPEDLERWQERERSLLATTGQLIGELTRFQETLPQPTTLRDLPTVGFDSRYQQVLQQYERSRRTLDLLVRQQRDIENRFPGIRDLPLESATDPRRPARESLERLDQSVRENSAATDELRRALVSIVAAWRLNNAIQIAGHEGRQLAAALRSGRPATIQQNPIFRSEQSSITEIMRNLQTMGLFNEFVGAHNTLVRAWRDELVRSLN